MSFIRRFNHVPLATKLLIAPTIVIILMTAVSAVSLQSVYRQGRVMADFGRVLLPRTSEIEHALDLATQTHIELFRTVTWATNSDEAAEGAQYGARVATGLRELTALVEVLSNDWGTKGTTQASISSIKDSFQALQPCSDQRLEMVKMDPATSFIMMFQLKSALASSGIRL